jgi:multidrug efflux pump subunit AcrA (membrane-fusion protein)
LIERIETIRNEPNTVVERAREEISRLRSIAEQQIADSDQLIARLRSQIGQTDQAETQAQIEQQLARIQSANLVIEQLLDERSSAEREYRILEAEVGPIKYIAEFVYGSTDKDLLEEAVRWVIIVIIFVFDPLAVLLLIASQFTFQYERDRRAARKEKENDNKQPTERGPIESEPTEETRTDQVEPATVGTGPEERDVAIPERGIEEQPVAVLEEPQKKSIESSEELNNEAETEEEIARLESWNIKAETLKDAKHNWKELHPEETIKFYKTLYIKGKIEQLPWEEEKYVQNSEQSENSLFKKIQDARKDE